jgi:hypothetical protein
VKGGGTRKEQGALEESWVQLRGSLNDVASGPGGLKHKRGEEKSQCGMLAHLGVQVGVVGDDLDGLLVGADGAVRAHAPEHALLGAGGQRVDGRADEQVGVGDVVDNADLEGRRGEGEKGERSE